MVSNATPSSESVSAASSEPKHPGGRPPEFDRDQVLDAAVFAFWSGGFTATTVGQLEQATGIDRSTLYKSFGGKDGLYESAADRYIEMASEQLFSALHEGTDGIADILEFVDRLSNSYRAGQPRGCYIVNDMGSVPEYAATGRYVEILQTGFRAALERAHELGEVPADSIERRRQFLTAAFIGINLAHRNMADAEVALTMMANVRAEVSTWAAGAA